MNTRERPGSNRLPGKSLVCFADLLGVAVVVVAVVGRCLLAVYEVLALFAPEPVTIEHDVEGDDDRLQNRR
jgi:hypothetical protein